MPYILKAKRLNEADLINYINMNVDCSGDLNYVVTTLVGAYVLKKGLSYQNIHDAVNTLYDAAAEFKRRVEFPYEDKAIKKNGDVQVIKTLQKLIEG